MNTIKKLIISTTLASLLISMHTSNAKSVNLRLETPLVKAIALNRIETVRRLLNENTDPNTISQFGEPALISAIQYADLNNNEIAYMLIDHNVDPNKKSIEGLVPLKVAIEYNNIDLAIRLILAGAIYNKKWETTEIISDQMKQAIKLALQAKKDLDKQDWTVEEFFATQRLPIEESRQERDISSIIAGYASPHRAHELSEEEVKSADVHDIESQDITDRVNKGITQEIKRRQASRGVQRVPQKATSDPASFYRSQRAAYKATQAATPRQTRAEAGHRERIERARQQREMAQEAAAQR